ncbi:uncharacterized protein LOC144092897 [Stigmatopora argus]
MAKNPYVSDDDLSPEKHDSAHVKQEPFPEEAEPGTLYIKKEEQEDEITKFPISFIVKSEEDEGPSRGSAAERTWFPDLTPKDLGEGDFDPEKHDPPHVKQERPYILAEAEPGSPYIKEEQEDQLSKFPMAARVKSQEDEGPIGETGGENPLFQEVSEGDLHPEKHHPRLLKQERPYTSEEAEPESPYIKEEQEDEIAKFPMTVFVKNQEDEGPSGESRVKKTLFQDRTPKEVSEGDLDPEKRDPLHVKQERPYILEEAEPGRPYIKKEEDDIINFPITVFVKSQEDEGPSGERAQNPLYHEPTPTEVSEGELDPEKRDPPHVKEKRPYIVEEAGPERTYIKETQEEITKSPMSVLVKTQEGEGPSRKSRALNPLFQEPTAKGEGPSLPDGLSTPFSDSDDVTSHSSGGYEEDVDLEPTSSKFPNESPLKRDEKEYVGRNPFACSHCDERFFNKGTLQRHKRTVHTAKKPFACSVCNKRFSWQYHLTRHTRKHTGENPFPCFVCGKSFSEQTYLEKHARTHTGEKPFACLLCDKRFPLVVQLKNHARMHSGEMPFACLLCEQRFSWKRQLMTHMRTHTGEKPFACPLCPKKFAKDQYLRVHSKTHSGERLFHCSLCSQTFSRKHHLTTHVRTHTGEKPFPCSVCGKRFTQKGYLSVHAKMHTGENLFPCSLCDKKFLTNALLRKHMEMPHGRKAFVCTSCGATFSEEEALKIHASVHVGEQPCTCPQCGQRFSQQRNLTKHMQTHAAEKPFACSLCPKKFATEVKLRTHRRRHTMEKLFACSECDQRFFSKPILLEHERTHTGEKPFPCSVCGKRFSHKGYLSVHARIHTGEKPFPCLLCEKSYRWKRDLKAHAVTHTGEKPFVCTVCGKAFFSKGNLTHHVKKHAAEKPHS